MTNPCGVAGCSRTIVASDLCMTHYQQKRRNGKLNPPKRQDPRCSIEGCVNLAKSRTYCNRHYDMWYRHGDPHRDKRIPMSEQTCQVADCGKPCKSRGLCVRHYSRYTYHYEKQHIESVDEFIQWDADRLRGPTTPPKRT